MIWLLVLSLSVVFGVWRIFVPSRPVSTFSVTGTYEALVHVWLGVLLTLSILRWATAEKPPVYGADADENRVYVMGWLCFVYLNLVELLMFFLQPGGWR